MSDVETLLEEIAGIGATEHGGVRRLAWTDEDALLQVLPAISEYDVYVCGPDPWTDAVCAAAAAAGLPSSQLHRERFSW